jgi:hypothetical protein
VVRCASDLFRLFRIFRTAESARASVHYVIEPVSQTRGHCEIQVRTLMEEVWGVDHSLTYPEPIKSLACREQIKALRPPLRALDLCVCRGLRTHQTEKEASVMRFGCSRDHQMKGKPM